MDEIVLKTTDQGIVSNAKELHNALPEKLKKYNYLVDAANYEAAKNDRMHLNEYIAALKAKRDEFEETDLKPWFDAKAEIMAMERETEAVSKALSEGINAIDDIEKVAKMERIRKRYDALPMPLAVPFEKLYDRKVYDAKKWTDRKIEEDLGNKINRIVNDHHMMQYFMPNDPVEQEQIKAVYIETLEIGRAKAKADELKALHEAVKTKQEAAQPKTTVVPASAANKAQAPKKQRIVAEFIAERAFYDEMNQLVRKHNVQCKVKEREEI